MFGREYSNYLEVLLHSFSMMSESYETKKVKQSKILKVLQEIYIKIFGIPEVGLQIRSLYFKQALSDLNDKKFEKILDAGSGIGIYSIYLSEKFPNSKVVGVDLDKFNVKLSNKIKHDLGINNLKFEYRDITKKTGVEKYDLIVNIDVLEHIENFELVLKNFYNSLNTSGFLYIHTPQTNQKRIFSSLEDWHHEDHIREGFNKNELRKDLEKIGYKIVKLEETFGFFGKLAWEINHMMLSKNFILSGITYPIVYLIASLDILTSNKKGLGISILAQKS